MLFTGNSGAAGLGIPKANEKCLESGLVAELSTTVSRGSTACSLRDTLCDESNSNGDPKTKLYEDLPPMDTGPGAWTFVASSFVLETLIWGFGFTFGVFQEYFTREKTFGNASEAALGAIGTVALGLEYALAMIVILIAQQWRHRIPLMMWICLGICCASLVGASFATQVWQMILLQGVCFGIGGGGLYAPVIVYLPEWFSARKGLAGAIIFGGAGAGGVLYPLALNYMLKELGFRWSLRIWAAYMLVLGALSLLFIKPRIPAVRPPGGSKCGFFTSVKQQDWSFVHNPLFLCISVLSFIQALGYFPVSLYICIYTASLGLPAINGTLVLAVFSLASVVGQVLLGQLCDIVPYQYIIIASGFGSCLAAFLLWGFAHNLGLILGFVILFGITAGGFTSVWPAACADIAGPENPESIPNVYGFLGITKGVAAVIGPVVAACLHRLQDSAIRETYSGYGFRDVTIFVGAMMFVTTLGGVFTRLLSRR
ncbi:MFS monocarboxylate transporter [Rhizoctonia solani 123E]|uniref:MFS monocarboxylate transporter n=1 Tax=Rhizoctonia solani 123E TaxID=1423351 RepID=A0A074RSJ4_9AGAM|nr:MFS monocarboxylate transporter [Rhizoctonia solani 123E]